MSPEYNSLARPIYRNERRFRYAIDAIDAINGAIDLT